MLISRGAFGPNRPFANLIVSPQHRIVLNGSTFAPAKALTALKGIREMRGKRETTWHHFACAAHIVVLANGVESESLLLGPQVLKLLRKANLQRLYSLFERFIRAAHSMVLPPFRVSQLLLRADG